MKVTLRKDPIKPTVEGMESMQRDIDYWGRRSEKFENAIEGAAAFLDEVANQCDLWAQHSQTGGWSTHQVDANRKQADACRRRAAELRNVRYERGQQ